MTFKVVIRLYSCDLPVRTFFLVNVRVFKVVNLRHLKSDLQHVTLREKK